MSEYYISVSKKKLILFDQEVISSQSDPDLYPEPGSEFRKLLSRSDTLVKIRKKWTQYVGHPVAAEGFSEWNTSLSKAAISSLMNFPP